MPPMYRVEDKFSCCERDLVILQARLKSVLQPDKNQIQDNGYKITSVYFDDLYDSCLQENEDSTYPHLQ